MSQVEVFTELHAYPIFFDIFVHDCGSYEGCYAKRLNFISINLKNIFKQEVHNLFF